MIATYDFRTQLAFSRGVRESIDIDTIRKMIDGCQSVVKTNEQDDKAGVDYVAKLRRGADILIDAKARAGGARKYWKNGPEVALEIWSVKPTAQHQGKTGWTLSEQKQTDLILFTFDPADTNECFLVSYQLLRMAFRRNLEAWRRQKYLVATQSSGTWQSECIFVPYVVVEQALMQVQRGYICDVTRAPEFSAVDSSMRMN